MTWSDDVARYLLDASACPRCNTRTWQGAPAMQAGVCARCRTDVTGVAGAEVWAASEAAVAAVRHRQELIDALPRVASPGAATAAPARVVASPAAAPAAATAVAPERPRSTISLQSVLAVVGAGLLAVAAIVFTFLNPDLPDVAARTTIIAVVTAVFLGGAWVLYRRRLQFSAEAVGALGMVFVALDVWAFSQIAPDGVSAWYFGALGLGVAAAIVTFFGIRMRMRTWLWSGLVGLAIVPAFVGYAVADSAATGGWAATWGHVGVVFAGWALLELVRVIGARLESPLRADRVTLTALQALAVVVSTIMALVFAPGTDDGRFLAVAGALAALLLAVLLTTRVAIPQVWSAAGGVLAVGTVVSAVIAIPLTDDTWIFAVVAGAVGALLGVLAVIRHTGSVRRESLVASVLILAALTTVPGLLIVAGGTLTVPARLWGGFDGLTFGAGSSELIASAIIGLGALGAGSAVLGRFGGIPTARRPLVVAAAWLTAIAVFGLPLALPVVIPATIAIAISLSVAVSAALLWIPVVRNAPVSMRAPAIALAHALPALVILMSWPDAAVAALSGAAVVGAWALTARTVPASVRPVHTATGLGYALISSAAALSLTTLDVLPILCLITTASAVVGIAASLTSWLPVRSWYAVLAVTAVPFGIGVVSVLVERSGWTALSTGVMFLLAATLLLTRREGTTTFLRAGAAALLVPMLAVVVVCLTAELPQSGSPIALPVIAVIVACALPTTGLVQDALVRRGYADTTAAAVRLAIEVSSLVTGALAVVLSLQRVAAGFEIAFVVLLVLGLGAAATALWMKRRYGWWTASAAWTGALWCAWAIIGVDVVEPYLLPPAAAAMIVGAVLVARRRTGPRVRPAAALFATGLGVAVIPSLAILAITGNGTGTSVSNEPVLWRALALMAAGVVLTGLAAFATRTGDAEPTRFESIRLPLLLGAGTAAAAGVVQGVRWGLGLDPLPVDGVHTMVQVLVFAVLASATAWAVARLAQDAGTTSRWIYAPALVYLVLGPMAAIDDDPASVWMLWSLEIVLLFAMIATAWRARDRAPHFPPVWFQFALAWVVAVVAWSQREVLRVEGFSLPLGIALLLVGTIGLLHGRRQADGSPQLANWPIGYEGSWPLLAPGIIVTLLPSVMATFTSPDTWRAITVIALALVAVLVGARKTLAAPFILGIAALPLEILVVFLVQAGGEISPLLWWITLATAGIVLLVIAVGWERRTGADATLSARIRDLR